jgi:hypothetical protein
MSRVALRLASQGGADVPTGAASQVGGAAVLAGESGDGVAQSHVLGRHLGARALTPIGAELVALGRPRAGAGLLEPCQFGLDFGARFAGDERRGIDGDVIGEGVAGGGSGGNDESGGELAVHDDESFTLRVEDPSGHGERLWRPSVSSRGESSL